MHRLLFLVMMSIYSGPLLACTVCGPGKEESRVAFIVTTAILTFIPLIMIGSIIYYIYRQVKARAAEDIAKKLPA